MLVDDRLIRDEEGHGLAGSRWVWKQLLFGQTLLLLLRLLTWYLSNGSCREGRRRSLLHSHIAAIAHQSLSLRGIFILEVNHPIACTREGTGSDDAILRFTAAANLMLNHILDLQMLAHDRLALKRLLLRGGTLDRILRVLVLKLDLVETDRLMVFVVVVHAKPRPQQAVLGTLLHLDHEVYAESDEEHDGEGAGTDYRSRQPERNLIIGARGVRCTRVLLAQMRRMDNALLIFLGEVDELALHCLYG